MMQSFTLSEAKLVATFLVTLTYGVYLVSAGLCARVLLAADKARPMKYTFMTLVAAMFLVSTIDVGLCFREIMRVFAYYKGPNSPDEEFENLSSWVNVMETSGVQLQSLIGDGILVYRCYVIFAQRRAVILVPAVLWLASGAAGIVIVYCTATVRTGDIVSSARLAHTIMAFLCITLVENFLTTGLIVWKIHRIDKEVLSLRVVAFQRQKRSRLAQVIRVIVESGLLYTIFVVLALVTELAGSNSAYVVAHMMLVVIGISFNLIIIRIGNGTAVSGYEVTTMVATENNHIRLSEPLRLTPADNSMDASSSSSDGDGGKGTRSVV